LFSDVPSAPTNLGVTETGDGFISVAWDTPRSDGGSPITGYIVQVNRSGTRGWTEAGKADNTTRTFDLTGLVTGEYYFVRVFAENQVGVSKKAADLSEPVCAKRPTSKDALFYIVYAAVVTFL